MVANKFVRQANGYDVDEASDASGLFCADESLTVQSQKDEADINVLVRRFGVTGMMPVVEVPEALLGHFEEFDMMTAQNLMIDARESFMSLDASVRARFGNDPMAFVQFCGDSVNLPELRKLGLAKPEVVVPPEVVQKVEIVEKADGEGQRSRVGFRGRSGRDEGAGREFDPAD